MKQHYLLLPFLLLMLFPAFALDKVSQQKNVPSDKDRIKSEVASYLLNLKQDERFQRVHKCYIEKNRKCLAAVFTPDFLREFEQTPICKESVLSDGSPCDEDYVYQGAYLIFGKFLKAVMAMDSNGFEINHDPSSKKTTINFKPDSESTEIIFLKFIEDDLKIVEYHHGKGC